MRTRKLLGIFAALALATTAAACGAVQHPGGGEAAQPVLDARDQAVREVEQLWLDTYAACERRDADACTAAYADGPDTLVIGTEPGEISSGRDAIVARWKQELAALPAGATLKIHTHGLTAVAARDGQTAWTDDTVTWEVRDPAGKSESFTGRQTSVVERVDGKWRIVLVHDSFGVPDALSVELATSGRIVAPTPFEDHVAKGAEAPAKRVRDSLADPLVWEGAIDRGDDVFSIGSAPDDALRGGDALRAKIASERVHFKFSYTQHGGLRAYLARTGTVAWVATELDLGGALGGAAFTLPLRLTFVLEQREGEWRIVQQHLSVALTPAQTVQVAQAG